MEDLVTWYVVADSQHARILVPRSEMVGLETVQRLDVEEGWGGEIETARPALAFPDRAPRRTDEVEFPVAVAALLDDAAERHEFDSLVLIALPPTASAIRDCLSCGTAEKIEREIRNDLTRLCDQEISEITEWPAPSV